MTKRWLLASMALLATAAAWSNTSTTCAVCHGANGVGISDDVPNLAGQKAGYLQAQLRAFRSGERKHDVMNPIARQLSDADVESLAKYWNSLPVGDESRETAATALAARRPQMTFPADFPQAYVNYYTQAEGKNVTRYYANKIAVDAARAGNPLPHGSIIMVEGRTGDTTTYFSGMEARTGWGESIPDLLRNGDWGYALFNAQKVRGEKNNYAMCLGCHKSVAADSFVFTLSKLKEHSAR